MKQTADLIDDFNAMDRHVGSVRSDVYRSCVRFTIIKANENSQNTDICELVDDIIRAQKADRIIIDLSTCRVVSSIDLRFIGYVINRAQFHKKKVMIVGSSKIVYRALTMVGFESITILMPNYTELDKALA